MKTNNFRATQKLSAIVRDTALHPVTDDLTALDHLVPDSPNELKRFEIFHEQLPALLELRGRGQVHSEQVARLIKLLSKEPDLVGIWIDVANAMTILTNAAHLLLMLLPVRSDDDSWTRGDFGRHLLNRARSQGDQRDIELARRVVGRLPGTQRLNLSSEPEAV
ncbi:MAG: hypothetical protein QHC89_29695, partial [Bosea sp. (in: a-proteobacteria)]|nr:hypothetical protein [Bosea sp. (in: a-proteobacteria)]